MTDRRVPSAFLTKRATSKQIGPLRSPSGVPPLELEANNSVDTRSGSRDVEAKKSSTESDEKKSQSPSLARSVRNLVKRGSKKYLSRSTSDRSFLVSKAPTHEVPQKKSQGKLENILEEAEKLQNEARRVIADIPEESEGSEGEATPDNALEEAAEKTNSNTDAKARKQPAQDKNTERFCSMFDEKVDRRYSRLRNIVSQLLDGLTELSRSQKMFTELVFAMAVPTDVVDPVLAELLDQETSFAFLALYAALREWSEAVEALVEERHSDIDRAWCCCYPIGSWDQVIAAYLARLCARDKPELMPLLSESTAEDMFRLFWLHRRGQNLLSVLSNFIYKQLDDSVIFHWVGNPVTKAQVNHLGVWARRMVSVVVRCIVDESRDTHLFSPRRNISGQMALTEKHLTATSCLEKRPELITLLILEILLDINDSVFNNDISSLSFLIPHAVTALKKWAGIVLGTTSTITFPTNFKNMLDLSLQLELEYKNLKFIVRE